MTKNMSVLEGGEEMNKVNTVNEAMGVDEINSHMEEIARDNKKAGKKFALVMLLCGIIGGIMGILVLNAAEAISKTSQTFESFMTANIITIGIIVPVTMAVLTVTVCMKSIYDVIKNKKNIAGFIAADDDESLEQIDRRFSYDTWMINGAMILNYFLFAVMIFADENFGQEGLPRISLYTVIVFLVLIVAIIVVQQRLVDCARLLNPEKKGSVYDLKFNEKWEESCDEVEKLIMYKACHKAFHVVNITCIVLWMIFVVLGLATGSGFLAVVCVSIIWAALTCTYYYYAIKYSRSK